MTDLVVDTSRSQVRLRTFAEGFFAKLAHDLELCCGHLSGTATRNAAGTAGSADLVVPLSGIRVAGIVTQGRLDPAGLSPPERGMCLDKMYREVFHAEPTENVLVRVSLDAGSAKMRVVVPRGHAAEIAFRPEIHDEGDQAARVTGSASLSLRALGSGVVRGPVNAFRVQDRVEVSFDVYFVRP